MADCDGQFHRACTDHEDILVEILTRLPVKSLMRFRCVCKPWRALISQSYFATKHRSYADTENSSSRLILSTNPPTSIRLEELENFKDGLVAATKLDFPVITNPHAEKIKLVGSCDGLICVEVNCGHFVLCNPYTGDSKVLPKPSFDFYSSFYGFGYDSTSGDYKLVIGHELLDPIIQVFTLKSGSWRTYDGLYNDELRGQGFFLNGALHWLESESQWIQGRSKIVSFHLGEEEFLEIPSPGDDYIAIWGSGCPKQIKWGSGFLTYRNRLCVFSGAFSPYRFSICMMKEYGVKESWTEVLKLDSDTGPQLYDGIIYMRPLCILENGEILVNKLEHVPQLALYNPKEKAFRDVIDPHCHYGFESVIYRETLFSPAIGSGGDI